MSTYPIARDWTRRDADQRVGDEERDVTCNELARHFSAGRLTEDEMQHRMDAAISARTRGDLYALVRDLPRPEVEMVRRAPTRERNVAADVLVGFFSVAAVVCFALLFLGLAVTYAPAAMVLFLGGLAGLVSMYGLWHFSTPRGPRPPEYPR